MKNILIITYWSFNDALIQTYTLPYVSIIRKTIPKTKKIFLVTMEQKGKKMSNIEWEEQKAKFLKQNIFLIRFSYSHFGGLMILKFLFIYFRLYTILFTHRISHIHTWCTPAGAIGYFLSIMSGKKLILDSFEPHAEPMLESGTWSKGGLKFNLLFWLEKKQVQKASHVITCVASMKDYIKDKYNIELKTTHAKPACVNFDLFDVNNIDNEKLIQKYNLKDKVVGVYAGKFGGSYLKEEVFQFLKVAEDYWGKDKFRFIILSNHTNVFIQNLIIDADINQNTIIHLFVSHNEVPKYLSLANFGITPFVPVPSKRYGSPIKNAEYWAMELPIIITKNISDDSDIIDNNNIGYVLKELTTNEYNKGCIHIDDLLFKTEVKDKIREVAAKYRNFEIAENIYEKIYA